MQLARGEVLSLYFYNRRIGLVLPMPHQGLNLDTSEFHTLVMALGREGRVELSRSDVVKLAQELMDRFGANGEEIA